MKKFKFKTQNQCPPLCFCILCGTKGSADCEGLVVVVLPNSRGFDDVVCDDVRLDAPAILEKEKPVKAKGVRNVSSTKYKQRKYMRNK